MSLIQDSRKLLTLLRARRRLALTVFSVIFGLGILVAFLIPKKYTSSMRILIRATPSDLARGDSVTVGQVSEEEVNSEVQLLTSYPLLEQAVVSNDLETPSPLPGQRQQAIDAAVRKLAGELEVTPVRKANIIEVQYSAKSPQLAASVLHTIENGYLDAHLRAQSTPGGFQFFQEQTAYYGQQLANAQSALAKFSSGQDIANLDQQRTLLTQTVSEQQSVLQQSEAQIAQLKSEIAESNTVLGSLSPRIPTLRRSEPDTGAVDHLMSMLSDLEDRRVKEAITFRDNDPVVQTTDAEIASARKALQNATSLAAYSESTDVNPISQTIQSGQETRTVTLAGLESKVAVLKKQIAENQAAINHLTDVSGQYTLLQIHVQNAQEDYNDYLQREQDARVSEGLDRSRITNVVMAQQPTESQLPVSSHRLLVLLFSFFFAIFASVAASVLAESFEQSYELQNA